MANEVSTQKADEMNFLVGLDFDLLKTNLNALYSKNENGYKLLLAPTKLDSNNSVTLDEMVDDFGKAFNLNLDSAKNALNSIGEIKLSELSFTLTQAFMYIDENTTAKTSKKEYALGVRIDATEALPDLGFIRIKSLSLAVWNTKRQTVLNNMSLGEFDKLLPA